MRSREVEQARRWGHYDDLLTGLIDPAALIDPTGLASLQMMRTLLDGRLMFTPYAMRELCTYAPSSPITSVEDRRDIARSGTTRPDLEQYPPASRPNSVKTFGVAARSRLCRAAAVTRCGSPHSLPERKVKFAARTDFAVHPDTAAHFFNQPATNSQTESHSPVYPCR
jgi:hypothetical protein